MRITPVSGYQYATRMNNSVQLQPNYQASVQDKNEQPSVSFKGKSKSLIAGLLMLISSVFGVFEKAAAQVNKSILEEGQKVVVATGTSLDTLKLLIQPKKNIGIYKGSSISQFVTVDNRNLQKAVLVDHFEIAGKKHYAVNEDGVKVKITDNDFSYLYKAAQKSNTDFVIVLRSKNSKTKRELKALPGDVIEL